MAEPKLLLPLTPELEKKANEQKLEALEHSGALMVGAGNALSILALAAPKTAGRIGHFGLGFKISPISRGAPTIRPTPFTKLYAMPPPLGIVPPEYYGASPTYLGDIAPWLPKSPFLATSTTPEREALHLAQKQRERLENDVLGVLSAAGVQRLQRWHVEIRELPQYQRVMGTELEFTARIIERELRFHNVEHPNLRFISAEEAAQLPRPPIAPILDEFSPGLNKPQPPAPQLPPPVKPQVVDPTFAAELVKAANTIGQANEDAAKGVNEQLVIARVDP